MGKLEFATFISEAPVIEISQKIVFIHHRGNGPCAERTMSVRTLAQIVERGQRALDRHAAGDERIVIDE